MRSKWTQRYLAENGAKLPEYDWITASQPPRRKKDAEREKRLLQWLREHPNHPYVW